MPGTAPQRFLRFGDGAIISAETIVNERERVGRTEVISHEP
jgi:hypothetical protein